MSSLHIDLADEKKLKTGNAALIEDLLLIKILLDFINFYFYGGFVKEFLRYQISGTVYLLWIVIFYYGASTSVTNLNQLVTNIHSNLKDLKLVVGLLAALPIGVIIHQFSVLIKNWLFSRINCELNDFPKKEFILKLNSEDKKVAYILERISNLNSFYYVRFDNGFLSPFLAWITISFFMDLKIHCSWVASAIIIGLITVAYIPRICSEIKEYHSILDLNLNNPTS